MMSCPVQYSIKKKQKQRNKETDFSTVDDAPTTRMSTNSHIRQMNVKTTFLNGVQYSYMQATEYLDVVDDILRA